MSRIAEEVYAVITKSYAVKSRHGNSALPSFRCADAVSLRALSMMPVGGRFQGTAVSADRVPSIAVTVPGTPAWSPPS